MLLKVEIQPGSVLEFETAGHAVALSFDDHQRSSESGHVKVMGKFLGVPHLTMLGFQRCSAAGFGVDLRKAFTTD